MTWGVSTCSGRFSPAIRALCAALSLVGTALLATPAAAKGSVISTQAIAKTIVVAQLSFFKVDDLNFGKIIAGTTAGTVTVTPTGSRSATGGAKLASDPTVKPARFAGKGSRNQTVVIAVLSNTSTLTRVGGTQKMTMDTFVIGSSPTATLTTAPLAFSIAAPTGIFTFPVGATLRVGANQTPGTYSGTFTITLAYQ